MNSFAVIASYLAPFKKYAALNVLLNALGTVFSLFSFTMFIPFLNMLFKSSEMVNDPGEFDWSLSSLEHLMDHFQYFVYCMTQEYGKFEALLFLGGVVLVCAFFRNFFLYMGSCFCY